MQIKIKKMRTKSTKELSAVNQILNEANMYGLATEVVYSALKLMKENNNLSITDALWVGRNEWIK